MSRSRLEAGTSPGPFRRGITPRKLSLNGRLSVPNGLTGEWGSIGVAPDGSAGRWVSVPGASDVSGILAMLGPAAQTIFMEALRRLVPNTYLYVAIGIARVDLLD